MMTVREVSSLTGVSIRTLQYYDNIGLLPASGYTESGYRLYDHEALARLQEILLFRELEFPLKDIKTILESPDYDRNTALQQQIRLLELKKEHIENLITFARGIKLTGVRHMDFSVFDSEKLDTYAQEAKAAWGQTPAYREFEEKSKDHTQEAEASIAQGLMSIFARLGQIRDSSPDGEAAQELVKKLQDYITANYYTCTRQILMSLGQMYAGGGEFTRNIDTAGGPGTAVFTQAAIEAYCRK